MIRRQWREVRRFRAASEMHSDAAASLLAARGPDAESELAYAAVYLGGYAVECILKARYLSAIRPKRHKPALVALKAKAGHDVKEIVRMLAGLRNPAVPPPDIALYIRDVSAQWQPAMRYTAREKSVTDAEKLLARIKEVVLWCER